MLLLKATPELKTIYERLIKTMKLSVTWTNTFVITNNNLILAGEVRSLVFSFDTKRAYTNIIEIPAESKQLEYMPNDAMLNNVMNMTLYVFGKWGIINGLKVDKDYETLNTLFENILRPVKIEPEFRLGNYRFFKDGVQITYEDTILAILRLLKNEGKLKEGQSLTTSESKPKDSENQKKDDPEKNTSEQKDNRRKNWNIDEDEDEDEYDYEIGLWHNMRWKKENCVFKKIPQSESDARRSRIGNNFYLSNYLCPQCGAKLYLGVYPTNRELLIDTEEGRVFMARTYACHECNNFYTPRPQKLLQEGDVYCLKFDDDRTAYEDYLEILGSKAERTTNYNFNEFESDRNSQKGTDEKTAPSYVTGIKSIKEQLTKSGGKLFSKIKNKQNEKINDISNSNNLTEAVAETQNLQTPETEMRLPEGQSTGSHGREQGTYNSVPEAVAGQLPSTSVQIKPSQATPIRPDSAPTVLTYADSNQTAPSQTDSVLTTQAQMPPSQTDAFSTASPKTETVQTPPPDMKPTPDTTILAQKTTDELKTILTNLERKNTVAKPDRMETLPDSAYIDAVKETLQEKLTAKYDARMGALNNLVPRQLTDLKNQIEKEAVLSEEKKEAYLKEINSRLYRAEENALTQKIELSKNKTYAEIERIIEDVKSRELPDELKQETLKKLNQIKSDRAEREVEHLMTHMPQHLDRKQLSAYLDKAAQYKEVDLTPYRKQIEQKNDSAELEEISALVKRSGRKDRKSLWSLYEKLQAMDYKEENKAPFLEIIHDKIRAMDEAEIKKICPGITNLSFAEGLNAYEQISEGMFLPELKVNTLEMIKRRLTKLKTDESVQLMRKLKFDMEEKMTDCTGFYFYNAREEQKIAQNAQSRIRMQDEDGDSNSNEDDNRSAMLCAVNGYASARNMYEYPLMVCDTSRSANGKEGFVLTPDHIFYHTLLNSGVIRIEDIKTIQGSRKIFGKGIYITDLFGNKKKLPNNVHSKDRNTFTDILNDFIKYLQERPESRSIEYMAKEKHDVIHCYRCGYVYKGGTVCPRCGSKTNR